MPGDGGLAAAPQAGKHDVDPIDDQILSAALALFIEYGIRRTTLEDIARRAGVNRVTIYRRFTDRSGLVKAALVHEATQIMATVAENVHCVGEPHERIVQGVVVGARLMRENALLNRLLVSEPDEVAMFFTVNGGPILQTMRDLVVHVVLAPPGGASKPADFVRAELLVRLAISLILNPESCMDFSNDDGARESILTYLLPLFTGATER